MAVTVTVKSAGRTPPASAKSLPVSLSFPGKNVETVTIGDVKAALQANFPRVRGGFTCLASVMLIVGLVSH